MKMVEVDHINENVLESFEHMTAGQAPSAAQLDSLWRALQWQADCVFPVLMACGLPNGMQQCVSITAAPEMVKLSSHSSY